MIVSDEARSTPELEAAEERPSGLPDQKSAARLKTPVPDAPRSRDEKPEKRRDDTPAAVHPIEGARARRDPTPADASRRDPTPARPPRRDETPSKARRDPTPVRPPRRDETPSTARAIAERPPGLTQMTTSARLRLQLVLDDDERPRIESTPPAPDPKKPPSVSSAKVPPFDPRDLKAVRSLGVWIGLSGLMTLTVGALTGLSYFTGEGKVANVVVGILASALSVWLLAAAFTFSRVGHQGRVTHRLIGGFSLLRSAFLLKAILLFAAMALGCFTFSLAASLLFLL